MNLPAEEALQHFVHYAENYFMKETWSSLTIEQPTIDLDYNAPEGVQGWVKISGLVTGWVMFTAPKSMVAELVQQKLGEEAQEGDCEDYIKEMASVVVSNSRRELGAALQVEMPNENVVFDKMCEHLPVFVVSMHWQEHEAQMVISLNVGNV
ncbi:MAG: hypothetical protein SH807_07440 [Blastochloris sp.]|nr:hypothetical protein [Blastochloris sp.]